MDTANEPPRIAGPLAQPQRPHVAPSPGDWDSHFHIFGPSGRFPYQPGRADTPPDAAMWQRILVETPARLFAP